MENEKYLELLGKTYKNIQEVSEEIINLQAILNLPKGTELFLSDIHGEYEAFIHILNNGSGIIKNKIEDIYKDSITEKDRKELATVIYYPEEKLNLVKKEVRKNNKNIEEAQSEINEWYKIMLYRLIEVSRAVSSKYTRSKVRKALPKGFDYIIDELLHSQGEDRNKENYYKQIIESIIDLNRADAFIIAISNLIKRMAIDHLHIIGDIYDRGPGAPIIMDKLMEFHSLDIQWGNHDILWMGAASGNEACIANVIRICSRYDNLATLEEGYGINIRPLSMFAVKTYANDDCKNFLPKAKEVSRYSNSDKIIISKIHKAISVIQFKLEGNLIKKHPEYKMKDRLFLDKINYEKGTVLINGKEYVMNDKNFPTIDPKNPYKLSTEEAEIVERLKNSFLHSEKLNAHINFLYSKGHMYQNFNQNVLFHGCIPMLENGEFEQVEILGKKFKGKELMDHIENVAHKAFFGDSKGINQEAIDYMWYFWCGPKSPLFGKDKAATFERYFLAEKELHKENKNPYYSKVDDEKICNKILENFGADIEEGHIINGHIPVKVKDGESPVRAKGKLIVIDGGFSKAYQPTTGIAGYTLTYNSNGLVLAVNEPFESKQKAIEEGSDIKSEIILQENVKMRKRVKDTDIGTRLCKEIDELKMLLSAYREGILKEKI